MIWTSLIGFIAIGLFYLRLIRLDGYRPSIGFQAFVFIFAVPLILVSVGVDVYTLMKSSMRKT